MEIRLVLSPRAAAKGTVAYPLTCVARYVGTAFPDRLARRIRKEFEKAVRRRGKGGEAEVLEELQGGDASDHGRNEAMILGALSSDDLRSAAMAHLYEVFFSRCEVFRPAGEASSSTNYELDRWIKSAAADVERHVVGPSSAVLMSGSRLLDGIVFVRHGTANLFKEGLLECTLERGAVIGIGLLHDEEIVVFQAGGDGDMERSFFDRKGVTISTDKEPLTAGFLKAEVLSRRLRDAGETVGSWFQGHVAARGGARRREAAERQQRRVAALNQEMLTAATAGDDGKVLEALQEGATVDHCGKRRQSALHLACLHRRLAVVRALLAAGASTTNRDFRGSTPLHLVCEAGWRVGMRVLLMAGAPIDATSTAGDTPVHLAAANGHVELLHELTQMRLSGELDLPLSLPNVHGKTAIDVAPTLEAKRALKPRTDYGGASRGVR